MKRKDYEKNNMSFDSMRPFYNIKTEELQKHSDNVASGLKQPQEIREPVDPKMVFLKNKISSSLLIQKQFKANGDDKLLIGGSRGGKLRLPKIREKLTLHITSNGAQILDQK